MDIFRKELFYSEHLTPSCAVDLSAYAVGLEVDLVEFMPPAGLLFRVLRIDGLIALEADTDLDDLVAVLVHVDPNADVPSVERLNALGSAAIFHYWAVLRDSRYGPEARKRHAEPLAAGRSI